MKATVIQGITGYFVICGSPRDTRKYNSKEKALHCAQTHLTKASVKAGKAAGRAWRAGQ